jgi:hypothetical protein
MSSGSASAIRPAPGPLILQRAGYGYAVTYPARRTTVT